MSRFLGITLMSLSALAFVIAGEPKATNILPYTINQFTLGNGLRIVSIPLFFEQPLTERIFWEE